MLVDLSRSWHKFESYLPKAQSKYYYFICNGHNPAKIAYVTFRIPGENCYQNNIWPTNCWSGTYNCAKNSPCIIWRPNNKTEWFIGMLTMCSRTVKIALTKCSILYLEKGSTCNLWVSIFTGINIRLYQLYDWVKRTEPIFDGWLWIQ